ncbi:M23 family metallopeptidase [Methanosarcina sp. UBA5]|uniref:M23 family metallopeptidase n=1 Tax=Methanosarcina sp. UBA5 TaxID=1915593 RepID=UPI002600450A|nr:M23 family metallopeptidase [Methanosarcina sp. UBA5]
MKIWPLKTKVQENTAPEKAVIENTGLKKFQVPQKGEAGSFWENRGDRYHCGVDLYAPENTEVVSIEEGIAVETGLMTSPEILPYWNSTYYVIIKHSRGLFCKYGELSGFNVRKGDEIEAGNLIGRVAMVLNSKKIDSSCPLYIQKLKNKNPSMLHFEVWRSEPITAHRNYLGGNWFAEERPENLVDPTGYLERLDL